MKCAKHGTELRPLDAGAYPVGHFSDEIYICPIAPCCSMVIIEA